MSKRNSAVRILTTIESLLTDLRKELGVYTPTREDAVNKTYTTEDYRTYDRLVTNDWRKKDWTEYIKPRSLREKTIEYNRAHIMNPVTTGRLINEDWRKQSWEPFTPERRREYSVDDLVGRIWMYPEFDYLYQFVRISDYREIGVLPLTEGWTTPLDFALSSVNEFIRDGNWVLLPEPRDATEVEEKLIELQRTYELYDGINWPSYNTAVREKFLELASPKQWETFSKPEPARAATEDEERMIEIVLHFEDCTLCRDGLLTGNYNTYMELDKKLRGIEDVAKDYKSARSGQKYKCYCGAEHTRP